MLTVETGLLCALVRDSGSQLSYEIVYENNLYVLRVCFPLALLVHHPDIDLLYVLNVYLKVDDGVQRRPLLHLLLKALLPGPRLQLP